MGELDSVHYNPSPRRSETIMEVEKKPKPPYIYLRWKDQPPIEFEMEVYDVVYDYKYQHHKLVGHATMKDGADMRVRFRVYTMLETDVIRE